MAEFTKEQLIEHINGRKEFADECAADSTLHPERREYYELSAAALEIALAALTAEPEVWEIENPGEGTFYSAHPPRDFEKASCVYYRLPLLEGLK